MRRIMKTIVDEPSVGPECSKMSFLMGDLSLGPGQPCRSPTELSSLIE